ncbi:MAG: nickel-dependent lactate racemase [Candidatus Eremiobacteraeota bacterium]|nr:nickel-dependent lactate racemase [Candidatus Eremiobacteraeota bacterium]
MMLDIPYGDDTMPLSIPAGHRATVLSPRHSGASEKVDIKKALEEPVKAPPLGEFLESSHSVLIIVNDATRPTPTPLILDHLEPYLKGRRHAFIIATGTHRGPSDEELNQIFGRHLEWIRKNLIIHDCRDNESLVHYGTTSFGTEVYLNKALGEFDKVLVITSVEPHYFAGYTGGRKSLNPGIAGLATVTGNHRLALRPEATTLALAGNPVHEDIEESAKMVRKEIFSVLTVLDGSHKLYDVVCGDLFASMAPAVEKAKDIFCAPLDERADIVITVATKPCDIDLYQSQKAIDNGKLAVKEGGILILVSKCRTGTGSDDFISLMASTGSPAETLSRIGEGYKLGYHKAAKLAEVLEHASIWTVTDIDPPIIHRMFMKPFPTVQEALEKALQEKGAGASVVILMDGSMVVPELSGKACGTV